MNVGERTQFAVGDPPTERDTEHRDSSLRCRFRFEHFGFIGNFFGADLSASSSITRTVLDWSPSGPTLLDDLDSGVYFR